MPLWLAATLSAALFQCWRTALQQKLRGALSLNAAAVVRYLYGVPPGLVLMGSWWAISGSPLPAFSPWVLFLCALGGVLQIFGTVFLIASFAPRGFAVGTAYSKTEALQGAIFAMLLLGEHLPPLAWAGVALGVVAVLWLSMAGQVGSLRQALQATAQPAALFGMAAGACFGLTGIAIRAANQELAAVDTVLGALCTLVVTNMMQTVMQGTWLVLREPASVGAVFRNWRNAAPVGLLSALGSACWFTGFALAPVALVRSVGQVEIVFTLAFGRWYLKEALKPRDAVGALLIVASVLLVILS
ncbi:DMT family transporter [Roseomonas sp. SSH11]|uniref:DMT family transporter n=1 Tax=Pararoseomonas baculiformis TaxID=2820812 RepID=A0ABS4ABK2_9PROT|nr:DMT family transporter [Pararoseomonas baculiformis]MBP0444373.1 DMT family transporter [Pararoseomonas baculiformis]